MSAGPALSRSTLRNDAGETAASAFRTLVGIQSEQGVLAAEADAEGPACGGGALGVRDLHEVDVAVDGDEIHAAQWVRANPGLPEGRPHLVPQLVGELEVNGKDECYKQI